MENHNEEIQRFPSAAEFVTYVQRTSRTMQRARRGQPPSEPGTTREWGAMLRSEEWRYRYMDTIGNHTRFYQGELVNENVFYGLMFSNTQLVITMKRNLVKISLLAIDCTYECLPNNPSDLRQLLTVHVIHNNMCFPVAYGCLVRNTQAAYETVMRYILQLALPYSNGPVQVIADFEIELCNAIRRVFPEWQRVGCSFHFNQAVLRHVLAVGLANTVRDNVMARNIVRLLLALPHLPSNRFVLPDIQGFTIADGLMMVRTIAIEQQVFEELGPLFDYFEYYWMGVVRPEGFSVYGFDHRISYLVESFHASLLGYFGIHPSLWTFYDILRGVESITRLEMHHLLNGRQVRRRFANCRNRNSYTIRNALENVQNGGSDTMQFLRRIAFINEAYLNSTLGYNTHIQGDPQEENEQPNLRPGRMTQELWREFFERVEDENDVEEVIANIPLSRVSPRRIENNDLEDIVELCIICFDKGTNVTLRPCSHKFCNTCTIKLMEYNFNTCPLCRTKIMEYNGIQL